MPKKLPNKLLKKDIKICKIKTKTIKISLEMLKLLKNLVHLVDLFGGIELEDFLDLECFCLLVLVLLDTITTVVAERLLSQQELHLWLFQIPTKMTNYQNPKM